MASEGRVRPALGVAPAAALLAIASLSISLNSIGLDWGLPHAVSWSPDSIAGEPTLRRQAKPVAEDRGVADGELCDRLLGGALGYQPVARFENRFLLPRITALGIWGWPFDHYSVVSPTVHILERSG